MLLGKWHDLHGAAQRAVGEPGDGDAFFWEVKAVRSDVDQLVIEVDKAKRSEDEQFDLFGAV